ncbi:B-cell receptor CD22, partial [Galemys pyrenaicus]
YLAFSDSFTWVVQSPPVLYAWDGTCVWIPCSYTLPGSRSGETLKNAILYQNYSYDGAKRDFVGTVLYKGTATPGSTRLQQLHPQEGRVQFLGDTKNKCTLLINPVRAQDTGVLGLRMVSDTHRWMHYLNLNISASPYSFTETALPLHIQLPAEIQELQEITLTCSLNFTCSAYPVRLRWSLEGTEVTSTSLDIQSVSTQSKLTFEAKWSHHGSNVTCSLLNQTGQLLSEKMVQLNVKHKPNLKIEVNPQDATVTEGQSVTMTCKVISSNPEHQALSWFKDGVLLGKQGFTLTLSPVTKDMSGKYQCEARNYLGPGRSEEVDLQVHYPPKEVTLKIKDPTQIREGDNVTLSCDYNSSNPRVTRYQWKLGAPQGDLDKPVVTIQKVAWNPGPVTCAACNQWCSWAASVSLDVQYAPRDVTVESTPGSEIHSGQRVSLRCAFSSSRPADVRFFWKKDGALLKEGKQLDFNSITPEDAGTYHCLANNSVGQTLSKARELRVLYAPRGLRVSISPQDGVVEGKQAALTCEGDADPPISHYAWFDWNGQQLHHSGQMLRLESVGVQHSGAYWCRGTNRLGEGRSPPSVLTVYYSPETIGKRTALGVGLCLAVTTLVMWGVKLQRRRKRIQSQQELQENSSGQSFFVRNKKVRRAPRDEGPHSLGCYNPVMEDTTSYAMLRFPDTPRTGDAGASESRGSSPAREDTVTYTVVQKRPVAKGQGDYENVTPDAPEDEGIHYSELVRFGVGERSPAQESVEYVTLKR